MSGIRGSLNVRIVLSNVREARRQLEAIEKELGAEGKRGSDKEAALEVGLGHAFHHLNAAWRARRWPMSRYREMNARDFRLLSQWPEDVWIPGKDSAKKRI